MIGIDPRALARGLVRTRWIYQLGSQVSLLRRCGRLLLGEVPHGPPGIREVGHRAYVGWRWEQAGRWQLQFMRSQGLRPDHYLLDVGCGSLRGGVHFIRYLEPGCYLGVDKEAMLIEAGVEHELGSHLHALKRPRLLVSAAFEFERLQSTPDYALAHSVFTHLTPALIEQCLHVLRRIIPVHGAFFVTYRETPREVGNPPEPHDHRTFRYTRHQMQGFGRVHGWEMEHLGNRDHPRRQSIARYTPC